MPLDWWLHYAWLNLGNWMTLFFYGVFCGFVVGGFIMWRRGKKWEDKYKEARQYANPFGDRQYHANEISPAMMQMVSMMVEKRLESQQQSAPHRIENYDTRIIRAGTQSQRRVLNGQEIEVFDDGTWRPVQ